jgi:hypothetical protein
METMAKQNNGYGVGGRGYGSNNGRMSQMNQTRDTEKQEEILLK